MTNGSSEPQLLANNVPVKRYNNYFRRAIWKTLSLMQNTQYEYISHSQKSIHINNTMQSCAMCCRAPIYLWFSYFIILFEVKRGERHIFQNCKMQDVLREDGRWKNQVSEQQDRENTR